MSGLLLFLLIVSIVGITYLWIRLIEYVDAVEERRWKWLTGNIGIDGL